MDVVWMFFGYGFSAGIVFAVIARNLFEWMADRPSKGEIRKTN